MKKGCGLLALGALALTVLLGLALLWLAIRARPLPTTDEALASLPESERAALAAACGLAGIDPRSLRVLGGASEYLFRDERNRTSLYVREGHVRALCLRGARFAGPPDLAPLTALETLWLQDGSLPGWPALASLEALRELRLDGQPLGDLAQGLPVGLHVLGLSGTRVADVTPLATLAELRRLDLADTPVRDFSPLLPLRLESLDLARTQVAAVPARLPAAGAWHVDLTGAPALTPPGFSWEGPGGWSYTGTALGDETREGGALGPGAFEIRGTGSEVPALRPVHLRAASHVRSIGPVIVEASLAAGRARIWLDEPPGLFVSEWFVAGRVKGFGFARRSGHVFVDVSAGETARLRGNLKQSGPPDRPEFHFLVEPRDGTRAAGLRFRVIPAT